MKYIGQLILLISITLIISCGVPKGVLLRIEKDKKVMTDFPVDYYNLFPRLEYDKWNKDYNTFNKFITKDIMNTQMWMAYERNGVQIAFCPNSAKTHVQIDTISRIYDNQKIIGDWRVVSNRRITYIDSAVYSDRKIYRDSKIIYDEKEADVFLVITNANMTLYGTEKGKSKYKKQPTRSYSIQNGRFLLQYGLVKGGGAVSFIGLDDAGRLILNWHVVEERKIKGVYITYQSTMTQLIFRKV